MTPCPCLPQPWCPSVQLVRERGLHFPLKTPCEEKGETPVLPQRQVRGSPLHLDLYGSHGQSPLPSLPQDGAPQAQKTDPQRQNTGGSPCRKREKHHWMGSRGERRALSTRGRAATGWGAAVLVRGTGSVWACRGWPGFILPRFPSKPNSPPENTFNTNHQKPLGSWQPRRPELPCTNDHTVAADGGQA